MTQEIIGWEFLRIMLYLITVIFWARLDQEIHDRAMRAGRPDLGIGSNKQSRVILRGLMIVALSMSNVPYSFGLSILGYSLLWMPLFNSLLAHFRHYNDDTPELGDTGIDGWFQRHRDFYTWAKILCVVLGIAALVASTVIKVKY